MVFPLHDITHYAVEQTLGYRRAFYGLVADSWGISDFAMPWPRGPIPDEAREVELVVGLFDGMRRERDGWNAVQLNAELVRLAAGSKVARSMDLRTLAEDDLARVRALRTICWPDGARRHQATSSSSISPASNLAPTVSPVVPERRRCTKTSR